VRGRLRDLLAYAGLRAVETLLLAAPPEASEAAARAVGRAWFALDRTRRRTALDNVALAFPSLGPEARHRLARASFEHAFLVAVEVVRRPRAVARARHARRLGRHLGDQDAMRRDVRAGRGGIVLGAHVGNWELAGAVVRLEGLDFSSVARPIENPWVDAYVARTRGGPDAVITKRGAARAISRALREDRWVGVLADQNAGRHGLFVPFFGVPASTYPLAATLAVRHRVPVYFGAAIRRGPGFRYDYLLRRHEVDPDADEREEASRALAAFHAWLEETIRGAPEQYLWLHRRWKTRPLGEAREGLPRYVVRRAPRPARGVAAGGLPETAPPS
jgi:KDO2-lipid IV(A) lauroyltransferase